MIVATGWLAVETDPPVRVSVPVDANTAGTIVIWVGSSVEAKIVSEKVNISNP